MSGTEVWITESAYADMVSHCEEAAEQGREACGYLVGNQEQRRPHDVAGAVRMANVADHPRYRYEMDPAEQLAVLNEWESRGFVPVAVYHSHVASGPEMSSNDMRYAAPGMLQMIYSVSEDRARLWQMHEVGGIQYPLELPFLLV